MKTRRIFLTVCLLGIFSVSAFAQSRTISGVVSDRQGPLPGATVAVKGTKKSVVTNLDGKYSISVKVGNTLVFSSVGFPSKEIKITKKTPDTVNVLLKELHVELDEFVVVGYGVQKKSDVTGSMSSIAGSEKTSRRMRRASRAKVRPVYEAQDYYVNSEEYSNHAENRFLPAADQPLSTFSLDVDAASYGNMRRMVNQGQLPPKDAVRVEELINYFSYDYQQPTDGHPVKIVTETAVCPWNAKHKLLRIGVKAKEIPSEKLPAANFVFLIDVSGSMEGATRLELVKSSLKLLVNNLRDNDRVAIVVYAGAAGEALSSTAGTDRQKIIDAIGNLTAGGSTAGGAGIQLAYKIAEKNFIPNGNNRIILCTDGDFNVGVSSNSELEELIESKRKTGVFLTVLGYGMGNYKDSKLQTLAQKGNGNHAYIDNIQEANKVLVNEFGSTMYTVAKDVKIQVEFNPDHVNSYRLVGYESRLLNKEDFNDDTKDAGELGSGHTVTALYEIIPVGVENTYGGVDKLKYRKNNKPELASTDYSSELLTVKLRYKKPDKSKSRKMEIPVAVNDDKKLSSEDFNFAMAVAMFGQLLKDSDFKGDATYPKVIDLARKGIGEDKYGYRKEFIRLAEAVNQLTK
ncbi:MAG: von Willebrand factor type A domain-containing protein [Prevotellaceae bacterium]|jgi:Ca-activated chloride channel family protein|nr:von Willebrand factor type A domain-containing protein [Prevotellaceae bacterium]